MTRQTGMVIYEAGHFRSYRHFAGLFICESTEGNAYLRQLEPPRHDKWDASRLDGHSAEAKNVLQSVRNWINECLRELNPDDNTQEPLAEESTNTVNQQGEDGILSRPISTPLPIYSVPPRPPAGQQAGDFDSPVDGHEAGDGTGSGKLDPSTTETQSPGGLSDTSGGGATGPNALRSSKVLLKTRSVRSGPNTYDLILRTANRCTGRLVIASVGEDNYEDKNIRVLNVETLGGGAAIEPDSFSLNPDQIARLRITIDSNIPLSLRAYCHGN
jgi:hypothetical protein